MTTLGLVLIGFGLVLLNAFFVAAEFGMVKLRQTRVTTLKQEYPWRGNIVAKVHQQLDAYLSACQLGITLASLGLGWVGEPAFANLLSPLLYLIGLNSPALIEFISFMFAFSLLSFLHIVVGELMPKSLAIRQSVQVCLWTAVPLYFFYWLMYPVIWVLNSCSNLFLKQLKLNAVHPGEHSLSSDEIKLILRSSQLHGEITSQESNILSHTLELSDLQAMDVMCSIHDMVTLNRHLNKASLISTLTLYQYSRYPVIDEQKIIGLVHIKDLQLLMMDGENKQELDLQSIIRPIPQISYRMPAFTLLKQFQTGMPHLALVTGRQEDNIGYVTLDNLLHIVIGVIKDEFHKTRDAWFLHKDGSIAARGDCPLFALERVLHRKLTLTSEQQDIATIAGIILHELGAVPEIGTQVEFKDFTVIIEQTQGTRITQVRIIPKPI